MQQQQYAEHNFYFFILFADGDLRVPIIHTLRYLGTTRRENATEALLFEDIDPDSRQQQVIFDAEDAKEVVLDGHALVEGLVRCFDGTLATQAPQGPSI